MHACMRVFVCVCVCVRVRVCDSDSVMGLCVLSFLSPGLGAESGPHKSSLFCQHCCPILPAPIHQPFNEVAGLLGCGKEIRPTSLWSQCADTARSLKLNSADTASVLRSVQETLSSRWANCDVQLATILKQTSPRMIYSTFSLLMCNIKSVHRANISLPKIWILIRMYKVGKKHRFVSENTFYKSLSLGCNKRSNQSFIS